MMEKTDCRAHPQPLRGYALKKLIPFMALAALIGCASPNQEEIETKGVVTPQETLTPTVEEQARKDSIDTYYPDKDFVQNLNPLVLPKGFRIDSTTTIEKKYNTKITVHYPISGNSVLDKLVVKKVNKGKAHYLAFTKKMTEEDSLLPTYDGSNYQFKLLSITESGDILCYLFLEMAYVNGVMRHPNHEYFAINFNRRTNTEVAFNDVLDIKTMQDSVQFQNLITNTINYPGAELYAVGPPEFVLSGDNILFCFSPYEVHGFAFGMFQANVPKSELLAWLKPRYR